MALGQSYDCPSASGATLKNTVIMAQWDKINGLAQEDVTPVR